jgi:hypothetical protein
MSAEQRDTKYSHLLTRKTRLQFSDLPLNTTFRYHIPMIHKQLDKQYDETLANQKVSSRPRWYVEFLGYYPADFEATLKESVSNFWVKGNKIMLQEFSGYGFFSFFEYCKDKFDSRDLEENDGVIITFRRGKKKNVWYMDKIEILKEKDYPDFVKGTVK